MTPLQEKALLAFESDHWHGPSVPNTKFGRMKALLAGKGLLERKLIGDNYGKRHPHYRLTEMGAIVRRKIASRTATPKGGESNG
jgi:hypothetical protein